MKRYTILHVDGERGLRGGQRQLLALACALRARGHRNIVCAREATPLAREARRLALEVRPLPLLGELDFLSAVKLVALARREGALVHAHSAHACAAAALAALGGVPVVMHRRVDFAVSSLSVSLKYGLAGKVVAVSRAIAEILKQAGVPERRLAVVTDAIATDDEEAGWLGVAGTAYAPATPEERTRYRRALAEELKADPAMTWIGNLAALVPHKDHDTLLAAALLVRMKRPDALFLIAGKGPEQERLALSIARMGLEGKVILAGHREEPLTFLKTLDAYCQSSWGEGMGSVLLEAAACGVPVAATTAGGIPEVVEDGVTGLLAPARDPEALAAALLRLLDDAPLRRRLADAARERLPRFGLRAAAQSMEKIYDSVA